MTLHRHVVKVASYLRDGFTPEDALAEVGVDSRYSETYRSQVIDEARDWWKQMKQLGLSEWR